MQGSNESQEDEQISISQQVEQKAGINDDDIKMYMSVCSAMYNSKSKEGIDFIVERMNQATQYDIETKIIYSKAMRSTKHLQLFLETNNNSTDYKIYMDATVEIMKALGKMLRMHNLKRAELDVLIINHIKNLTKKKDAEISIIEEINAKIKHLQNRDIAVQTDPRLHQIEQTEGHEQREGKKRKEVHFLEDDKVQQKRQRIAQNEVEENFIKSKESGTLEQKQGLPESLQQRYTIPQQSQVSAHQVNTANEGQFRGELSHGFLEQLEAMQQLVQQLRRRLLLGEVNQKIMNKNKTTNKMMQEVKLMRNQEEKAKKQQWRQQEIVGMINVPVDLRHKE